MRKKTVLFFVFEGYADWEAAHALVGIRKSGAFNIKTIALRKEPVKSMAGLTVNPDLDFFPNTDLKDIDDSNTAMLILPGGTAWEDKGNRGIASLVRHCVIEGIPVAAICGATLFLADLGLLDQIDHTSNDREYLQSLSPSYRGHRGYQFQPAVADRGIITANGVAAIEFAGAIFECLGISELEALNNWYQYFQKAAV